jgi:hypothetical protein
MSPTSKQACPVTSAEQSAVLAQLHMLRQLEANRSRQ